MQYWKDHILIEIKGTKPTTHQLEEHMKYDGMKDDEVNRNGKHQWMSMDVHGEEEGEHGEIKGNIVHETNGYL